MINNKKAVGPILAAIATTVAAIAPAFAAQTVTTTTVTTTTKPVVLQGSVITSPTCNVTGFGGKSVTAPSPFPIPLTRVEAANGIVFYYAGPRENLSVRRDDLFARILIEESAGFISSGASNDFVNRLVSIDNRKASTPSDSNSRTYHKYVKDTYNEYDRLAQDLKKNSHPHQGDGQLAGAYQYTVY
ncbi:MAG: hypothetical protein J0H83_18470 [Candidatus Melainabacteria bacterium]|jgi:hypothetical protein|nr:hypothetical protein [Candidatus Melainabacteria bacterium]MBX9673359.1 hypothetical protein [Candidatus Obscuribacterales bacterium]